MLPSEIDKLIKAAKDAMGKAIAPYSQFKVGAALITDKGKIYKGCNIENPSLMLTLCAERAVLSSALSEGEKSFKAIAIVSNDKRYCFPCGACRQMLSEFAPDIRIYLSSEKGTRKYSIPELLPFKFVR